MPLSYVPFLLFRLGVDNQAEQIRVIDGAKAPGKRRKGVAFFVRHFPVRWHFLPMKRKLTSRHS